jgi:ketopantoate reductase
MYPGFYKLPVKQDGMKSESRICIVGAGAVGGVLAGVLTREGHPVQLLVRQDGLARKITEKGIRVGQSV